MIFVVALKGGLMRSERLEAVASAEAPAVAIRRRHEKANRCGRSGRPSQTPASDPYKGLDSIPQMIWSTRPDGHHDYFSKQWYDFTGVPFGSTDGDGWNGIFHPDDQERAWKRWRHSLQSGETYEIKYRLRHKSGNYRWVLGRAWPEQNDEGEIVRWYGTCTDIDDQVVAEQNLARSEARFREILDSLPGMVWSTLPDGTQDYANEQWEQFAGKPLDQLDGNGWVDLVHEDDAPALAATWQHCLTSGESYEATFRFRHHSGEHRWVCSRGTPQRDDTGSIIRWYGTCVDVHERVVAEHALRTSEALNSSILVSSPDCIKLLEEDGTILYVNPLGPKTLDIDDPKPLIGACWFDLLPQTLRETAKAAVARGIAGSVEQFNASIATAKGTPKWFDILVTPVTDASEVKRVVVIARDITSQKQAEQALRQSEALYRSVLETSDDCITITDLEGNIELINAPGVRAIEIESLDRLRGKNSIALWPTAAQPALRAALDAVREGRSVRFTELCPTAKGTPKWWDVAVTPMRDEQGEVYRALSIARDITATREATDQLRWTSEHDSLTSLPNRRSFQAHLQAATIRAMESGGSVGLLLLDLDHFKHVNDTLGHPAGDHLLKTFSQQLKSCVRGGDMVARLGGDEFAIILQGVNGQDDLLKAGESILARLQAPIFFEGRVISAGASIGGALFPGDACNANELFKNADTALYALKNSGRGGTRMFHNYMREEAQKVASQLSLARTAISNESVIPHYQQKVALATDQIIGFEALLRWHHPTQGIQLPDTVAEAFKDYELASKIGELMQRKVFEDISVWRGQGLETGRVSINAAPAEFLRDDYAEKLLSRLDEFGLSGEVLEVEVTEHVFLERGSEYVSRALMLLNKAGVKVSLDDFGTGYSSLSHLRDFPVDVVKIDRSFIAKMLDEPEIAAIVSAVIDLAASLSLEVVAEGVETLEQEALLRQKGCTFGQGYRFGRAARASEVPKIIERSRSAQAA